MSKQAWKLKPGATWRGKLEQRHPKHGTVVDSRGKKLLIPRPRDVDAAVRRVRKGRVMTISTLRNRLAEGTGADSACPLCTGIFLRIVAEAAEEDLLAGRKRVAPWWRVVRDDGSLNPKLPGGIQIQASRLRTEGVALIGGCVKVR